MRSKAAEESQRAFDLFKSYAPEGLIGQGVRKEDLVNLGRISWEYMYKHTDDDSEVGWLIDEYVDQISVFDPVKANVFSEMFKIPDQNILNIGSARWYGLGLPVIRLGHKRAAAMMATNIGREAVDYVKPPFPAFFIEMPDGLLHTTGADGSLVKITGVLVHEMNLKNSMSLTGGERLKEDTWRWRWAAITDTEIVLWQLNRKAEELVGYDVRESNFSGFGFPIDDRDERVSLLIGRLICAACLVMSNPEDIRTKKEPAFRRGKKVVKGTPTQTVYSLETPISVDARPALGSYLRGERNSPNIRSLVRGHFKPNLSARLGRIIWVHPYARGGDEHDPLMQRVYKVGEERETTTEGADPRDGLVEGVRPER